MGSAVTTSMALSLSGNLRQFINDADSFTDDDVFALAIDVIAFAVSPVLIDASQVTVSAVYRSSRGVVRIEYALTVPNSATLEVAMDNIAAKVSAGTVYQFTDGSRAWPLIDSEVGGDLAVDTGELKDEGALEAQSASEGDAETIVLVVAFGVSIAVLVLFVMIGWHCRAKCGAQSAAFEQVVEATVAVEAVEISVVAGEVRESQTAAALREPTPNA